MEYLISYFFEWLNLLLRWLHLIVGIAWIGASFYFVWLDNSLIPPKDPKLSQAGVSGELWAVHGGGFYNPQKYLNTPPTLPENLHWFYWEAYSTWITGFLLFTVAYLFNPTVMLVDKQIFDMSGQLAIALALVYLVAGWFVYDIICRFFGVGDVADKKVAICLVFYVTLASIIACHLFAGRAAFLLTGAMLATIMAANVFFWVIPGQKTVIKTMRAGGLPDPVHGQRGKQRSVHNTFFTLPVLFAMLSNHYSMVYNAPNNWLVLILIMAAGAIIRFFFVARHKNKNNYLILIVGIIFLLIPIFLIAPPPPQKSLSDHIPPNFSEVSLVIQNRCIVCHNENVANKNIRLDSPEAIQSQMNLIYQQAVVTKQMPINNATGITDDERLILKRWFNTNNP